MLAPRLARVAFALLVLETSGGCASGSVMGGGDIGVMLGGGDDTSGDDADEDDVTVQPPPQMPPRSPPGSCGLESPAFCEDFEVKNPGGRSGDLDEMRWSFARWGHQARQHFVRVPASTHYVVTTEDHGTLVDHEVTSPAMFCGQPFTGLLPGNDVAICDGIGVDGLTSAQLNEVYDDQTDFAINSNRIRQLFDFTDRTGTIVFDVDAKVNPCNLGHGWWIELWITEDPAPIPYHEAPGVLSYPRNGVVIPFQGLNNCPGPSSGSIDRSATQINGITVLRDFQVVHDVPGWELQHDSDSARCFKTADGKLNRIKVMINKDQAEIWASDYDDPLNLHRIAIAPNLNLSFTRGYVHLEHSQYNGRKDLCPDSTAANGVQTYRWDNVGFDGPAYVPPRGYGVNDNDEPAMDSPGGHMYGWYLKDDLWVTLKVQGVDLTDALSASVDYSFLGDKGRLLEYRFNGGPAHQYMVPAFLDSAGGPRGGTRAFSHQIPVEELVNGENTIEFRDSATGHDKEEYVGNVELTVQPSQ